MNIVGKNMATGTKSAAVKSTVLNAKGVGTKAKTRTIAVAFTLLFLGAESVYAFFGESSKEVKEATRAAEMAEAPVVPVVPEKKKPVVVVPKKVVKTAPAVENFDQRKVRVANMREVRAQIKEIEMEMYKTIKNDVLDESKWSDIRSNFRRILALDPGEKNPETLKAREFICNTFAYEGLGLINGAIHRLEGDPQINTVSKRRKSHSLLSQIPAKNELAKRMLAESYAYLSLTEYYEKRGGLAKNPQIELQKKIEKAVVWYQNETQPGTQFKP